MSTGLSTILIFETLPDDIKRRVWGECASLKIRDWDCQDEDKRMFFRYPDDFAFEHPLYDSYKAAWMGRNAFPFCKRGIEGLELTIGQCRSISEIRNELDRSDIGFESLGECKGVIRSVSIDPSEFDGLLSTVTKQPSLFLEPVRPNLLDLTRSLYFLLCAIRQFNEIVYKIAEDSNSRFYASLWMNADREPAYEVDDLDPMKGPYATKLDEYRENIDKRWEESLQLLPGIEAQAREVVKLAKEAGLYY